ncbi:regulatory signaling modulator protein AmpE [Oceanicoccus sp. KOV_DT_Chl]|uniref:regulatory signaling modulator protein AmpE n=1 Tax=Oceanicoccus sp. KOV_DT_Chl TaxID=1904639 RepID=UPI000C7CA42F|nr:regulatory signaling modulator protein AmpE [Oceanicoccus sp. KOV_DT_Chl]
MEFLSLLIVLGLLQVWGSGGPVQQDQWLHQWYNRVSGWLSAGHSRLIAVVVMPVILLILIAGILDDALFGLPLLIVTVVVLLYSLGRGDYSDRLTHYLTAWNQGNFESAYEQAMAIGDFEQSDAIADHESLHEHVRRAYLYDGFERWFAVVFWFLLLGPVVALVYRLSYLLGREQWVDAEERQLALRLVHYLDWLPVRLLVLSFSLTGNFVNSFSQCWQQFFVNQPSSELLDECAVAAINNSGHKRACPTDPEHCIEYGREELLALQGLLSRSVICWVVVAALLIIL